MSDYISREAVLEAFENADADVVEYYGDGPCDWGFGKKNIREVINSVPAADVEPVRRIQWTPYADGQTDTSGFAANDDYLLRTSTGYILPGYWDDQFKEWTVPIEYDAAKDWADKFGQIVGFMKIQHPEDPA